MKSEIAQKHAGWQHFLWVLGAAVLGFAITSIFSGWLQMPRVWFLVPYVVLTGLFLYSYAGWCGLAIGDKFRQRWGWGLLGALLVGVFVVRNVLSQPASPRPGGLELVFLLIWLGGVYGMVDALLLSVFPILATWQAFAGLAWTKSWPGKLAIGALAIVASLLVTVVYHLGYAEFRGSAIMAPVIGNGSFSLIYLLTTNPLSAVLGHVAMHVAAVFHGLNTAMQLPPHY